MGLIPEAAVTNTSIAACLDSKNATSGETQLFTVTTEGFLCITAVAFGVVGNVGSVLMLKSSKFQGRPLGQTLILLAIWDIVLLLSVLGYYSLQTVWVALGFGGRHDSFFGFLVVIFHPITAMSYTASAWLVLAITAQRFKAVHAPLTNWSMSLCEYRIFSKPGVAFYLSVAAVLINIPAFFELRVYTCWNAKLQRPITEVKPTALRQSALYVTWYRLILLKLTLTNLGPSIVVVALTLRIMKKLHESYKTRPILVLRRRSSAAARDAQAERLMTIILVIVIAKFVISHTIPAALDFWEVVGYIDKAEYFRQLVSFSNFIVALNSATNFIVYMTGRQLVRFKLFSRCMQTKKHRFPFTVEELARLQESWDHLWNSEDEVAKRLTSEPMGVKIMREIYTNEAMVSRFFPDAASADVQSFSESEAIHRHSDLMSHFLLEIINDLSIVVEFQNKESEARMRRRIQSLGRLHYHLGITFTTHMWSVLKKCVVAAARRDDTFHDKEETARVWNQFISYLIYQMKQGFLEEATAQCRMSFEYTRSGGTSIYRHTSMKMSNRTYKAGSQPSARML